MDNYMTTKQILDSARETINKHIVQNTFKGNEGCEDDEENFYTIESLYLQWSKNRKKDEDLLWVMFDEEYNEYF